MIKGIRQIFPSLAFATVTTIATVACADDGAHEPTDKLDARYEVNTLPYPYNTDSTGSEDVELELVQFNVPEKRANGWDKTITLSYLLFKTTNT